MVCKNCRCKVAESDALFCPNCGAMLRAQSQDNVAITEQPRQKSKKKKKIIALIAVLVTVIIIGAAVFLIITNRQHCFKMEPDGNLYLDDYNSSKTYLIPTEFDGVASSFDDSKKFYKSFKYDGSLKRFLKYYYWLIMEDYPKSEGGMFVYCNDYTLLFAVNGETLGSSVVDTEDGPRMAPVRFSLYRDGKSINDFESLSTIIDWLQ